MVTEPSACTCEWQGSEDVAMFRILSTSQDCPVHGSAIIPTKHYYDGILIHDPLVIGRVSAGSCLTCGEPWDDLSQHWTALEPLAVRSRERDDSEKEQIADLNDLLRLANATISRLEEREPVLILDGEPTIQQVTQVIYDVLNHQYGDFNWPDDAAEAVRNLYRGVTS